MGYCFDFSEDAFNSPSNIAPRNEYSLESVSPRAPSMEYSNLSDMSCAVSELDNSYTESSNRGNQSERSPLRCFNNSRSLQCRTAFTDEPRSPGYASFSNPKAQRNSARKLSQAEGSPLRWCVPPRWQQQHQPAEWHIE
jgi:hypothetical protein